MDNDKFACVYIRVSTTDQDDYSPDAQLRLLKEYAKSNNITITKIYQDIGISGRKADKRPAFQEMIGAAKSKEHPYDMILVWKFSRFARNQEESIVYKNLLKKANVDVISVSEPLPDGFIGELVERIFEWMDEYYSIRLSGEVKRGMTQKAMAGGYNGNPPCGYKKEKGADTIPYIDEAYADMVRSVFYMFVTEKRSLTDIAFRINEQGYRTRRGRKWESRNIADMIQNPFYIGKVRWNYTENRSRKLSGDTIIRDGKHEPLIDSATFEQANIRYKEIGVHTSRAPKTLLTSKHYLAGLLRCSECGSTLSWYSGYDKKHNKYYPSFKCWKSVRGQCTHTTKIKPNEIEGAFLEALKYYIENMSLDVPEARIEPYRADTSALDKQIEALNIKLKRIKEAYIAGVDTLEEYTAYRDKFTKELDALKAKKAEEQINNAPIVALKKQSEKEKYTSIYEFLLSSDDPIAKGNAIREIIDQIVVDTAENRIDTRFRSLL